MNDHDSVFDPISLVPTSPDSTHYTILHLPNVTLAICEAFLECAKAIALDVDRLIKSDLEISDRILGLKLCCSKSEVCGDLLYLHAHQIIEDLLRNQGTSIIEVDGQIAETFCILVDCGVFVPVPHRTYYTLEIPNDVRMATVRRSLLRLLNTVSVQLHPEEIIGVVDTNGLFKTLEDLGQLPSES